MKLLITLPLLVAYVSAQTFAPNATSGSSSSIPITSSTASNGTVTIGAAEYTITALAAVQSQPACVFNCLIPIGLADPSNCDDVTNDCACLSAPADVEDVLTDCIQTVCKSSTESYEVSVTSLYQSYCNSIYGGAVFTSAYLSNVAADAAAASSTVVASPTASSVKSASGSASATPTKNQASMWTPSLLFTSACAAVGALFLTAL